LCSPCKKQRIRCGKIYFITFCITQTSFGCSQDYYQGVLENTNRTYRTITCYCAQVKQFGVMDSTLGTASYNSTLVYILINRIKFKLLLKLVK
jgi:hypothetical protein